MFPKVKYEDIQAFEKNTSIGKMPKFDYGSGQHIIKSGEVVMCEGSEALKQLITSIVTTCRNKYLVYTVAETEEYGLSIYNSIGDRMPQGYILSELKREIYEQVEGLIAVQSIGMYSASLTKRGLNIEMTVVCVDESEVEINYQQ